MAEYQGAWSHQAEIDFISGLGSFSAASVRGRLALLEGYLLGLEKRVEWGNLNGKKLAQYAQLEIDLIKKLAGGNKE